MLSSKVTLTLLVVACFAGLVLSASTDNWYQRMIANGGCKAGCDFCQKIVEQVQQSGQLDQAKEQLEGLCAMLPDADKIKQCKDTIDGYLKDLQTKSPLEVCKEFKFCQ